jgi:hypothetical protein
MKSKNMKALALMGVIVVVVIIVVAVVFTSDSGSTSGTSKTGDGGLLSGKYLLIPNAQTKDWPYPPDGQYMEFSGGDVFKFSWNDSPGTYTVDGNTITVEYIQRFSDTSRRVVGTINDDRSLIHLDGLDYKKE